jgi:hypothetical protein
MRMLSAAAALAALTFAVPAAASTPAEGEVSAAQPKTSWSGEAYGQPFKFGPSFQTHDLCIAPFCDTYTLTVADPGALQVFLNAPGSAGYVDVLVTKPDGATEFLEGVETEVSHTIVYRTAQTGAYTFDIWPNEIYGVYDGRVTGAAELCPAPTPFAECFVVEEDPEEEEL